MSLPLAAKPQVLSAIPELVKLARAKGYEKPQLKYCSLSWNINISYGRCTSLQGGHNTHHSLCGLNSRNLFSHNS